MSEAENTSKSQDTRPKTELLPVTGTLKMDIKGSLEIEETVLIVCEGHCFAIPRSVITTSSTLFAAKLSERWNSLENGQETFRVETITNFSWKAVQILIDSIKANVNGYCGSLYDGWLEDDACLVAEVISLADYIGSTQHIQHFWKYFQKLEKKISFHNVLGIFQSMKRIEDIMETKKQCHELQEKCTYFLSQQFSDGPLKNWMLDNKADLDLVVEMIGKTKLK